jgi:hypothetical protein
MLGAVAEKFLEQFQLTTLCVLSPGNHMQPVRFSDVKVLKSAKRV